jgi:hypothetical protein
MTQYKTQLAEATPMVTEVIARRTLPRNNLLNIKTTITPNTEIRALLELESKSMPTDTITRNHINHLRWASILDIVRKTRIASAIMAPSVFLCE